MTLVIPNNFKTFGPLGEERIARGNSLRTEHGTDLIQDSNHQYAKLCLRWTPLVASMQRIKNSPPPTGIVEEWLGILSDSVTFERAGWTIYTPQKDRLNHTFYFDFEEGQVRYRVKPSSTGLWGAYVTSPVHNARATWTTPEIFADTSVHQIEVDLRSLVTPLPRCALFAAVWVEDIGSL